MARVLAPPLSAAASAQELSRHCLSRLPWYPNMFRSKGARMVDASKMLEGAARAGAPRRCPPSCHRPTDRPIRSRAWQARARGRACWPA